MMRVCTRILLLVAGVLGMLFPDDTHAQKKNQQAEAKKSITQQAYREGLKLISTTPKDTVVNEQSNDPFNAWAGYIIRNIYSQRINFEHSIYDSTKKINKTLLTIADALHGDTREKIIYNHLFIKPNEPLIPGKVSDNERFLRDLDFILDSRIIVSPVEGTDSVDLVVVTRDVFSLGFNSGGSNTASPFTLGRASGPKLALYDANINGRGQLLEYTALVDPDRTPYVGNAIRYRKSSFLATKGNLELGYTQINNGRSFGEENEFALYTRYYRPLVSPYTRLAGGFELSRNWSENVYNLPDSTFLKYRYSIADAWLGFNMGVHRATDRNRVFLALRYFDGNYQDQPEQPEYLEERQYNDIIGVLSEITWYRQDYFRTRYVYGFGRTEDVPYGYSLGFTLGHLQELNDFRRPYAAIKYNYSFASQKGNFYDIIVQLGSYFNDQQTAFEDIVLRGNILLYSRLLNLKRYKLRGYASAEYAAIKNHQTSDWFTLNARIIPGFSPDDLDASQRAVLRVGASLFTPWTLIGFRMAPLLTLDIVNVECISCTSANQTFLGFTTGLRMRNENLIFGTIEAKLSVIPRNAEGEPEIVFRFSQNLRIKKTAYFVRPPSIINYNQ